MDYKDKVVNAEVILPDGHSIGGSGLPSQSFKLHTEDTATIKLSGNGEKATPLKGVVVVAEDENNALQAGESGLAVKVSSAGGNLLELKQGALYVTTPEINIPISPKDRNALVNISNPGEEGLYVAPNQKDIYDRTEGIGATPGMFGFGEIFSSRTEFKTGADFLNWVKTANPGRYAVYADKSVIIPDVLFSGTVEIIWPTRRDHPVAQYVDKIIIFYGINGDLYYNRYWNTAHDQVLLDWQSILFDDGPLKRMIATKAPLESPVLTGTPSTPTPTQQSVGTQIANVEFVKKHVSDNTYTLSAGDVTLLESGSQPTVEITGESPSQVLNLGIPKAPDGQTLKSVNAVVKEVDNAQQVTLTFTMTDDSSQQASFNIPFSPQPTMKTYQQSGNFSFNYSDNPNAYNAAGKFGSSIYLKTTIDLTRLPMARNDAFVTVRLLELPCTEDGTILNYNIFTESPNAPVGAYTNVPVWLVLPSIPTHTIDPKTKQIKKLVRGDGPSGLDGVIPVAGPDEPAHEFRWYLRYQFLNN